MDVELSDPQYTFVTSDARNRAFVGGIGSGKTFSGAIAILNEPPGSVGMVVAPTYPMLRDSSQRTFFDLWADCVAEHKKAENETTLTNGTRILWRSADHPDRLRGPNLAWAWGDEWAFSSLDAHRVLQGRLRVGRGRFWVTTTPNGFNFLYRELVDGPAAQLWQTCYASTASNTTLPPEYLDTLRAAYEGDLAAQELDGAFIDTAGAKRIPGYWLSRVFDALPHAEDALPGGATLRVYQPATRHGEYVIGADPAEGLEHGDDSAAVVLDAHNGDTVAVFNGKHAPEAFAAALEGAAGLYNGARVLVERNNHGHAVLLALRRLNVSVVTGPDGRPGWPQTTPAKTALWVDAHRAVNEGAMHAGDGGPWRLRDRWLKDQIAAIDAETLAHPEKGKRKALDDGAMAWALAVQQVTRVSRFGGAGPRPGRKAAGLIKQPRRT